VTSEGAEDEGYGDDPVVRNPAQGERGRGRGVPSEGAEDEGYGNEPALRSRGRGGRGRGRGVPRAATKGKNFVPEEERQLTRSVLAISQDPIRGNQ
jgi:hypothetical protein